MVTGDVIVNCTGILNAECDKDPDEAMATNALLPHQLAKNCDYLIHISTDCVFDGKENWKGVKSPPNATSLYGRTKALGEIADDTKVVTLRQSVIGPSLKKTGAGLLHWALTREEDVIPAFLTHSWNGVTTLELSNLIVRILKARQNGRKRIFGLYHYVTEQPIVKHDLLLEIKSVFELPWEVEAQRPDPVLRCLASDPRMKAPPDIRVQIEQLRSWMLSKPQLYNHYRR
jgi:dTDP-4-dehydrorhamnose reductase